MRFAVAASIAALGVASVAGQTPVTYTVTDATWVYQYTAVEVDGQYTSDALITSSPVAGGAGALTTTSAAALTPTTPIVAPVTTTPAPAAATTTRQPGVSDAPHNDGEEATGWSVGKIVHDAYELKHLLGARDVNDEEEATGELQKRQQGAALGGGGGTQVQATGLQTELPL
ncbi:hypothetical protein CBOM_04373 [Ceraceosorus bombacis]|uniref:Uncharacterized protein n=1 Tax=Ceraceosorus bombacis TaxID=401625 RepID=A0A0P1BHU8_9BASI|nr:hypothetical protein CBOM_04373 [Ceraceosorus bombacis]